MSQTLQNPAIALSQISRTKTIATVGPASANREILCELLRNGADVFRLNMAHGSRADHETAIQNIRAASVETGIPAGILVDLAGPKIRMGQLASDPLNLNNGQTVHIVPGVQTDDPNELVCLYEPLIDEVKPGDAIVLADGLARLKVVSKSDGRVECLVVDGAQVRSRQGVNLPGTNLSIPALGAKDIENAIWAAGQQVDFVSLSFVRNAKEIKDLKAVLVKAGSTAITIAKIEKREALDKLDEIIAAADGIMVARGDLGVEVDVWKTPLAQKRIIKACLAQRKPVIVATQMLESMHTSKIPTRAEVSDVANAILDGADACMLSGETAIGDYPVEAVAMMQKIMLETEQVIRGRRSKMAFHTAPSGWEICDAVAFGSAQIARRVDAKMVVIASNDGDIARIKSKQRDFEHTICMTDDASVVKRLCLYWGVVPVQIPSLLDSEKLRSFVDAWAKLHSDAVAGDPIVIVSDTEVLPGVHDTIMVARIS